MSPRCVCSLCPACQYTGTLTFRCLGVYKVEWSGEESVLLGEEAVFELWGGLCGEFGKRSFAKVFRR